MPNVPIQTGKKQFVDSFGNTQDVTKGSALGPLPVSDDSRTGRRYQPISVWNPSHGHDEDWRTKTAEPESGYGMEVDRMNTQMIGTDGQPVLHAGSANHPLNRKF